jgi:hypothetical protein
VLEPQRVSVIEHRDHTDAGGLPSGQQIAGLRQRRLGLAGPVEGQWVALVPQRQRRTAAPHLRGGRRPGRPPTPRTAHRRDLLQQRDEGDPVGFRASLIVHERNVKAGDRQAADNGRRVRMSSTSRVQAGNLLCHLPAVTDDRLMPGSVRRSEMRASTVLMAVATRYRDQTSVISVSLRRGHDYGAMTLGRSSGAVRSCCPETQHFTPDLLADRPKATEAFSTQTR